MFVKLKLLHLLLLLLVSQVDSRHVATHECLSVTWLAYQIRLFRAQVLLVIHVLHRDLRSEVHLASTCSARCCPHSDAIALDDWSRQ